MVEVHGSCAERFEPLRAAFGKNFDDGLDDGASVALSVDGELVVDLWAGTVDEAGTPWQRDTLINVWSTTKTMTALCALLLADRGELDLHAPVARYWPEFAAAGKADVQVSHLLAHTAGLPGWNEPLDVRDLYDWEKVTTLLARQQPWWQPGTASGYHAVTQGFLVGEVVRRVSGQSPGAFFAEQFAGPLDADFHIGLGPEHDDRVALVVPPPDLELTADAVGDIARRALSNPTLRAEASWTTPWRRAEIPAANGHGNARSVARVQSVLACGGELDGRRFLTRAGAEAVLEEQSYGTDLVLGLPIRFGLGYGLKSDQLPVPSERVCFWGGWGGSLVLVDLDRRMVLAYVMNRMGSGTVGDLRGFSLALAAYASLDGG